MLQQIFKNTIEKHQLCEISDEILVAVSGGKDSMALLHLFYSAGYTVSAAHVNFNLRGAESDADEAFVSAFCLEHNIPLYVKIVDTLTYASQHHISTQMAARELRYSWFNHLMNTHNFRYLAMAHQQGDNLETILLGIAKGIGPVGLCGIPIKKNKIIRPLLEADIKDILTYLSENKITWREDSSNQKNYYARNRIRNKIIPELFQINPGLARTFKQNLNRFQSLNLIFQNVLEDFKTQILEKNDEIIIPEKLILETTGSELILEEYLKPYKFTSDQVQSIIHQSETGKTLISPTHILSVNRGFWHLRPNKVNKNTVNKIESIGEYLLNTKKYTFSIIDKNKAKLDYFNPNNVFLDANKIQWPLYLRIWEKGDRFQPFGMQGTRLVSDFLKDLKINPIDKKNQLILTDSEKIAWIIGHRIDDNFKVSPFTTKILSVKVEEF